MQSGRGGTATRSRRFRSASRRVNDLPSPVEDEACPLSTSDQQCVSSNDESTAVTRHTARRTHGPSAKLDLVESLKEITVTVELPGIKKEDVEVYLEDDGILYIQAERKQQVKEDTDRYHCSERSFGKISRQLWLPTSVDADNIQSRFENGLLELCLPKKVKDAKRKKIEI